MEYLLFWDANKVLKCHITVAYFYRSLTDLPKNFFIITENIFFVKPFTDGGPRHIACGFHLGFIEIVIGLDWLTTRVSSLEGINATMPWIDHPVNDVSMHITMNHQNVIWDFIEFPHGIDLKPPSTPSTIQCRDGPPRPA